MDNHKVVMISILYFKNMIKTFFFIFLENMHELLFEFGHMQLKHLVN